eukprot:5409197-Amphidinium_carterae.1
MDSTSRLCCCPVPSNRDPQNLNSNSETARHLPSHNVLQLLSRHVTIKIIESVWRLHHCSAENSLLTGTSCSRQKCTQHRATPTRFGQCCFVVESTVRRLL